MKNYEGLNAFGFGSEKYRNNPLEVEAYAFGDNIEKIIQGFYILIVKNNLQICCKESHGLSVGQVCPTSLKYSNCSLITQWQNRLEEER